MESYIFSLQCFFTSSQADVPLLIGYFSLSFTLQSRLGYFKYCFKSAPFISSLASFNAAFYRLFLSFTTWQSRLWISHFRFNEIYEKVHLLSLLRQHDGEGEPVNFETSYNDDDEKSERMAQICITNIYDFLNSPQSKFTAYIIWSWCGEEWRENSNFTRPCTWDVVWCSHNSDENVLFTRASTQKRDSPAR